MGVRYLAVVLLCYAFLTVLSSFAMILELVALLQISSSCLVTFSVLWLFLTVAWVFLQCVVVVLPVHTHILLYGIFLVIDSLMPVLKVVQNSSTEGIPELTAASNVSESKLISLETLSRIALKNNFHCFCRM